MKCLIPTESNDNHSIMVKRALEKMGHKATIFFPYSHHDKYDLLLEDDYDVVWWRRNAFIANQDDYSSAIKENAFFYDIVSQHIKPNAWWINPKDAANRANFKLLQLKIASDSGLTIPTTLCSDDPHEIQSFFFEYGHLEIIRKPLYQNQQRELVYPSRTTYLDCSISQSINQKPSIFQTKVIKKYNLRLICFGDYIVAIKLSPRALNVVAPFGVPLDLAVKVRAMMSELGIVFGTFDFIVTPENEFIFLDLNEQGSFLWIENYNPALKLLDIFVNFLLNQSTDFMWNPNRIQHSLEGFGQRQKHVSKHPSAHHSSLDYTGMEC